MDKQEIDILIDKSILGTLTSDESSKLEAYIMKQPTIKLEIKMRKDILKGLEYNADQELKDVLNKIHDEEITNSSRNSIFKRLGIIILCMGLLFGAFSLYQMFNTNTTAQDGSVLYANYFEPYTPSVESRNNVDVQEAVYQIFIDAYRNEDYEKSLEVITPLIENADNNTLLLAGISAMELDKTQESIGYFDKIISSNDFYFVDHAKWYKALVLLKTNKIKEAKLLLNELASNQKADHHDESVALLMEI